MTEQPTPRRKRRVLRAGLSAIAVGTMLAGALFSVPTAAAAADSTGLINGYRNVGYFAQWGVYARDFKLKALKDSGSVNNLTHINYSFGNINNQTLKCFIANKAQGTGPNGSDGAGDAWADFGMGYTTANSVNGAADTWDQPLAGSFNQLKQLRAVNPNLKPIISLGGWTWSKNFSAAAKTDASRKALVSSCIDLYIKGNLPVIDGRGGTGAAAGVFDGIDIDWEWPGSLNGNEGNTVDVVNDKNNFRLLLKEFRTQLDAYGATTGKHYTLSAFLPANPEDIASGGWNNPEIFTYLDFGNIQGYDLWGAWAPSQTGHQGNLYDDPADPRAANKKFSVDKAVKQYLNAGIKPSQLGLGLATYGRGWTGATSSTPWGPATGAAPGTYEAGNEDYDKLKTRGTDYYNAAIGAAWRYDGTQWWSYDNPRSIAAKADYIVAKGLGGGMWWELSGNKDGTLVKTLTDKLRAATTGPNTQPTTPTNPTDPTTPTNPTDPTNPTGCASAAWSASTAYTGGTKASYNGNEYKAKWWTQGETPTTSAAWELVGSCATGPGTPTNPTNPTPGTAAWNSATAYVAGSTVTYGGKTWKASWWTQGDIPGAAEWGPWKVA